MNECRICLEEETETPFIKPCNCESYIHSKCLKEWILAERNNNPTQCEICLSEYTINFKEMFSEQLMRLVEVEVSEEESESENEEHRENNVIITIQHIPNNQSSITSNIQNIITRRQSIRRQIRYLTQHVQSIKEKSLLISLLVGVYDCGLCLAYLTICDNKEDCEKNIITIGLTGSICAFFCICYNTYLICHYNTIRRRISI